MSGWTAMLAVLGGMNDCAISDLEGLAGAKSFETPRTPIVEKQGVDKGLKSVILALRRYQRGAKRSLRPWRSRPIVSP